MNQEEKLDFLVDEVTKIKRYLENDDTTNTVGIVESVRENKRRLHIIENHLKTQEKVRKAQVGIIGFVSGLIGTFIWYVIKEILGKKL